MYRTYAFQLTTWAQTSVIRGRMMVGDLKPDGTPDVVSGKLWTPADLDVQIEGCGHGLTLPMDEFVAGAAHIVCCSARMDWDALTVASAPCTTTAKVHRHPAWIDANRT